MSKIEREVKLRFDDPAQARQRILAAGAIPLRGRRLQEDSLFDTDDERLRRQRCVLRIRSEGGKSLLTYKGPVQVSDLKVREEHETIVADGDVLRHILRQLGLHVWFRYEKFREEFSAEDLVIAVDETPVGTFVEIEGGETRIHEMAAALGRTPADYVTESYRGIFLQAREAFGLTGRDMVFAVPAVNAE